MRKNPHPPHLFVLGITKGVYTRANIHSYSSLLFFQYKKYSSQIIFAHQIYYQGNDMFKDNDVFTVWKFLYVLMIFLHVIYSQLGLLQRSRCRPELNLVSSFQHYGCNFLVKLSLVVTIDSITGLI